MKAACDDNFTKFYSTVLEAEPATKASGMVPSSLAAEVCKVNWCMAWLLQPTAGLG